MNDTDSNVPSVATAGMVKAHAALATTIAELSDEVARRPSLLPGWSVGHVLTHIARNADSVTRRLQGAAENRIVDQYAGGAEGRQHDIEDGAGRSAAELIADVLRTNHQVEAAVSMFPALGWDRLTRSVGGEERPAHTVVWSRWHEVEVHHVDLGMGYRPQDWPDNLVDSWLPEAREHFLPTADQRELLAWLLGRGSAPRITPWG